MFNKNDPTVIRCSDGFGIGHAIVISMKDKTIKLFLLNGLYRTYTIGEESEAHITGLNNSKTEYMFISRYEYVGIIRVITGYVKEDGKLKHRSPYSCWIGTKKF